MMVMELYIMIDGNELEYWGTYNDYVTVDEALMKAEKEYGNIATFHIKHVEE